MENAEAGCEEVLERLYIYLDGELAQGDCADIDRHLSACGDCLKHFDFERDIKSLVGRKCRESQIPDGLVERVKAKLNELI